jgi:hypothetical protein
MDSERVALLLRRLGRLYHGTVLLAHDEDRELGNGPIRGSSPQESRAEKHQIEE